MDIRILVACAAAAVVLAGCSPQQTAQAGNKVKGAGQQAGNAVQKAGSALDDVGVTIRVKGAMEASSRLNTSGINVNTKNRVVYLKGTVPDASQRKLADTIARDTVGPGVKVVDQLAVGQKPASKPGH